PTRAGAESRRPANLRSCAGDGVAVRHQIGQRTRRPTPVVLEGACVASVRLRRVEKYFGGTQVIRGVDVEIADGEFAVLVGPSGCGKSTLLRMIAGLEQISSGEIEIGGKVVNRMPPKERDIAMVFQNYALYPHMTVRDNMAFSLLLAKRSDAEVEKRVADAA